MGIDQEAFYQKCFAKDMSRSDARKHSDIFEILRGRQRVLDIGCGDGSLGREMKALQGIGSVYGVDISEQAVREARSRGINAYCVNVDKTDLPFADDYFDAVFCGELLEHLYDPDHLLDEMHRVLKQDGICIITTPNLASWYNRLFLLLGYQPLFLDASLLHPVGYPLKFGLFGHIRGFTEKAITELCRIHNFKIVGKRGYGINTRTGYGKRFRFFAEIFNKIFFWSSVASDLLLVLQK